MLDKAGFWIALLVWALIWATLIRCFLSIFKAWAIKQGEAGNDFSDRGFGELWRISLLSCGRRRETDDYWLPFLVGFIELCSYPLLIGNNRWEIIGAWLGIKTASQWRYWGKSRTPYNRFLLGCLLPVGLSYLFLQLLKFVV